MKAVSLASGSKGNSYLIQSEKATILVDLGICEKELLAKLELLKINPKDINAIFITHEHDDHIKGLSTFLKDFSPKIYIHADSVDSANKKLNGKLKNEILLSDNQEIVIGDMNIKNFKQSHDSNYCCGYSIDSNIGKVSVSTDLGIMTDEILRNLDNSNLVYLESNHDERLLLENENYPVFLKRRILSNSGHLSNKASYEAIKHLTINNVSQVVLSHLSEENNSPSLAYNYIKNQLLNNNIIEGKDIFIDVASQYKIGTIFNISK